MENERVHELDAAIAGALSPLVRSSRMRGVSIETHLSSSSRLRHDPLALQLGIAALVWDCLEQSSTGDVVFAWSRRENEQAVVSIVAHGDSLPWVCRGGQPDRVPAAMWLAMVRRAAEEQGGHVSIDVCRECAAAVHIHLPLCRHDV